MPESKVIGLTGPTGSGKTTVGALWVESGKAMVIDCDLIARRVVEQSYHCLADLALAFSVDILNRNGTLNRKKLAQKVFGDKNQLARLNATIFPYIIKELEGEIALLARERWPMIVLDAPTLFESGADKLCWKIVSVIAPENMRMSRILVRDHLTDEEARARINAQQKESFYADRSTYVVENRGDPQELCKNALQVLDELLEAALLE